MFDRSIVFLAEFFSEKLEKGRCVPSPHSTSPLSQASSFWSWAPNRSDNNSKEILALLAWLSG